MKNYAFNKKIFKYACILTTGRTGSDYLQGCLDGVPGIITFSGEVPFYKFIKQSRVQSFLRNREYNNLIKLFIKKHYNLFYKDKLENKELNINTNRFIKIFLNLSLKKNLDQKIFLKNIYLAYHLTLKRKILKSNTIVHHSHHVKETESFIKDFKNTKLLITIRDPRANLKSGIQNWFNYDKKKRSLEHSYLYLRRIHDDFSYALKKKNKYFVRLEDMQHAIKKRKILNFLSVKFSNKVNLSTFADKIWKGDKLSKFNIRDGKFNKANLNNNWKIFFSKTDLRILNFLYYDYKKQGYFFEKVKSEKKLLIPFLFLLPFKYEKKLFMEIIFFKKSFIFSIKSIYFYLRKILFLYKIYFQRI